MGKSLTEMASEIVAAQASHAVMGADEMVAALKKTFDALKNIKTIEEGGPEADAPPVDPRKSIQRNYIINLEDGKKYKQLTTRTLAKYGLTKYGLTPAEYRKKWGFSARQPLAAKALSAKRRKTAKALGLGERLQEARKAKAAAAAKAKAKASKAKTKAKPKPKKKRKAARKKKKA
jgi:predicted transcriptional regulator